MYSYNFLFDQHIIPASAPYKNLSPVIRINQSSPKSIIYDRHSIILLSIYLLYIKFNNIRVSKKTSLLFSFTEIFWLCTQKSFGFAQRKLARLHTCNERIIITREIVLNIINCFNTAVFVVNFDHICF